MQIGRVPRYGESTTVPKPRLDHRASDDPTAGAGMQALADGLEQVGTIIEQEAEADAVSWVSRVTADAQVHWARREAELRSGAGEGAPGHTQQMGVEWDQWFGQMLEEAPNDLAREMLTERLGDLRSSLRSRAVTFQHGAVTAQRTTDFGLTVDRLAEAVRTGVMSREAALAQFDGDLAGADRTWMLPEAVSDWRARREGLFRQEEVSAAEGRLTARVQVEPWRYVERVSASGTPAEASSLVTADWQLPSSIDQPVIEVLRRRYFPPADVSPSPEAPSGSQASSQDQGAPAPGQSTSVAPTQAASLAPAEWQLPSSIYEPAIEVLRRRHFPPVDASTTPDTSRVSSASNQDQGLPTPEQSTGIAPTADLEDDPDFQALDPEGQQRVVEVARDAAWQTSIETIARASQRIEDEVRLLQNGQTVDAEAEVQREEIDAAFQPDDAEERWEYLLRWRAIGARMREVRGLTPQEQTALLVAQTDATEREVLQAAIDRDRHLRTEDPVAYVLSYHGVLNDAVDRVAPDSPDSELLARIAQGLLGEQQRIGISDPRPMPRALVDTFLRAWGSLEPQARVDYLRRFASGFDDAAGAEGAFAQLAEAGLPWAALTIATLDPQFQARAAYELAIIAGDEASDLRLGVPANVDLDGLREGVEEALTEFHASTLLYRRDRLGDESYLSQAVRLTHYYVGDQIGLEPEEATALAADGIANARYNYFDIDGHVIRVPVRRDAQLIEERANALLGNPDAFGPVPVTAEVPEQTPEQLRQLFRSRLADSGFWVTAPDDSGLVLMIETLGGGATMVPDRFGVPITMSWDELEGRQRGDGATAMGLPVLGLGPIVSTQGGIIETPAGWRFLNLDIIRTPFNEAIEAALIEGRRSAPTDSLRRSADMHHAESGGGPRQMPGFMIDPADLPGGGGGGMAPPPEPVWLDAETANRRYGHLGLNFDEGVFEVYAELLAQRRIEELTHDWLMRRAEGPLTRVGMIGAQLGAGIFDPINLAASFIPVYGQARVANRFRQFGRTAERFVQGVYGSAVTGTASEIFVSSVRRREQSEISLSESAQNVIVSSILGGFLNIPLSRVSDFVWPRVDPSRRIPDQSPSSDPTSVGSGADDLAQMPSADVREIVGGGEITIQTSGETSSLTLVRSSTAGPLAGRSSSLPDTIRIEVLHGRLAEGNDPAAVTLDDIAAVPHVLDNPNRQQMTLDVGIDAALWRVQRDQRELVYIAFRGRGDIDLHVAILVQDTAQRPANALDAITIDDAGNLGTP